MGTKLKILSGTDVADILAKFGFVVHSQKGSHLKLRRIVSGTKETLIIPSHDPISKGTLKAVFNQASRYIPEAELRKHFYH